MTSLSTVYLSLDLAHRIVLRELIFGGLLKALNWVLKYQFNYTGYVVIYKLALVIWRGPHFYNVLQWLINQRFRTLIK